MTITNEIADEKKFRREITKTTFQIIYILNKNYRPLS